MSKKSIPDGSSLDHDTYRNFYISNSPNHVGRHFKTYSQVIDLLSSRPDIKLTDNAYKAAFDQIMQGHSSYQTKPSLETIATSSEQNA